MDQINFSVVTNIYGKDNPIYFQESLNSIFNQTLKANEIVLVVDGEIPDELEKIIKKNKDKITKIIRLDKNVGLGLARQRGILESSYEYIAIMDSDDIAVENRFELQVNKFLNNKSLDIVGGQIEEINMELNQVIGRRIVPTTHNEITKYMKKRCPLNHVTVMFKKKAVIKAGNYLDLYYNEDYYLWIRMYVTESIFSNLPEVLVKVRVDSNTYRRRGGIKYFNSEKKVFKYMLKNGIIGLLGYYKAIIQRFILQILMPNRIRGYIFKKFSRKK